MYTGIKMTLRVSCLYAGLGTVNIIICRILIIDIILVELHLEENSSYALIHTCGSIPAATR